MAFVRQKPPSVPPAWRHIAGPLHIIGPSRIGGYEVRMFHNGPAGRFMKWTRVSPSEFKRCGLLRAMARLYERAMNEQVV